MQVSLPDSFRHTVGETCCVSVVVIGGGGVGTLLAANNAGLSCRYATETAVENIASMSATNTTSFKII